MPPTIDAAREGSIANREFLRDCGKVKAGHAAAVNITLFANTTIINSVLLVPLVPSCLFLWFVFNIVFSKRLDLHRRTENDLAYFY